MHKRLEAMKQNLASIIEAQLCNITEADCEELGEAIDMLKDLEEALYFQTIIEAMNGNGKYGNVEIEYENRYKKNGHNRMSGSDQMYYSYPMMYNDGNRMYNDGGSNRMYNDGWTSNNYTLPSHSEPSNGWSANNNGRDQREGRSPQNRRMYMEAKGTKDKATQLRELEKYMQELTSDMVEMIQDASPEEKQYLEKKISALATKIGQMK